MLLLVKDAHRRRLVIVYTQWCAGDELVRIMKQEKMIEEQNSKKKQLLTHALAARRAKTSEEANALRRIEQELAQVRMPHTFPV